MPSIRWTVAVMMVGALSIGVGLFLYLSDNTIRDYDLKAQLEFVRVPVYDRDIGEIKLQIKEIVAGQKNVSEKLDRNFEAFQKATR